MRACPAAQHHRHHARLVDFEAVGGDLGDSDPAARIDPTQRAKGSESGHESRARESLGRLPFRRFEPSALTGVGHAVRPRRDPHGPLSSPPALESRTCGGRRDHELPVGRGTISAFVPTSTRAGDAAGSRKSGRERGGERIAPHEARNGRQHDRATQGGNGDRLR